MLVTTLVINVSFIGENMQCDGVYNQGFLSDDLSHLYGWYHQSPSKVSGTAGYQCTQYFCDERQFLQTSDRGYETRNSTVPGPWMIPNYFPLMYNEDGTSPSPAEYYTFSSPSSVAPPASSDQYAVSEKKVAPTKKHPCYVCFKTYARPGTLKVHMRIHNGEKPYRCTYCKRAFSQSGNLAAHIRIHTGEKPYCCTTCDKSFTQSSSLKTHQKTH